MLARYMLSCVRLFVRPSQAGIVSKPLDESSWFLALRLRSTFPTLCCKGIYLRIWVPRKITVLSSGILSQTPDVENYAAASRSRCQQNSPTVELVDDTYTTVDESRLSTTCTPVSCNRLTQLLWLVADFCATCFYRCASSLQDFDWHSASRGPSAVAELLVADNNC